MVLNNTITPLIYFFRYLNGDSSTLSMTDTELWKHIINNDKVAFEELYHRYYSPLLSYAQRLQFNEEIIKDCIQDLFVKIYINRQNLPVVDSVKPYLYRSLTNSLLDKVKSIRNNTISIDELMDISIEDEGVLALFKENDNDLLKAQYLKNALNQLSTKQKNALYFRFIKEFTWEEMAEMFQMSEHSCMNLVSRGISNLRAFWKKLQSD